MSTLMRDLAEIAELQATVQQTYGSAEPPTILGVNAHSGSDMWHEDEAADFFESVHDKVTELGHGALPRLSHETHRGRVLCCPFVTRRLLARLPGIFFSFFKKRKINFFFPHPRRVLCASRL